MRVFIGLLPLAFVAFASPLHAQQKAADVGGTCSWSGECRSALRCLRHTCVEQSTFGSTHDPIFHDGTAPHGYIGFTLGALLPTIWGGVGEGAQLALHVGVIVEKHVQLQLEVSPASTVISNVTSSTFGLIDVVGTIGYLVPLSDLVSWIFRVGGGGGTVFSYPNDNGNAGVTQGFGEVRFDLIGVAIRPSQHLTIEFNVPSFRVMILPAFEEQNVLLTWSTSVAVNYLF